MISFDLFTKVMDVRHLPVLEDWLAFVPARPVCLHIYTDLDDVQQIETFAQTHDMRLRIHSKQAGEDLRNRETDILARMFATAEAPYAYLINLDTLPYREGNETWLTDVSDRMAAEPFAFFSTCGLRFMEDDRIDARYLRTQRFSNNHALISIALWFEIMELYSPESVAGDPVARFHSEWAIESWCQATQSFGLRREASLDWRVFHVQQWDDRLLATRAKFRSGRGVKSFLGRVYRQEMHPWEEYFNYPKPPLIKRARIAFGAWRRRLLS